MARNRESCDLPIRVARGLEFSLLAFLLLSTGLAWGQPGTEPDQRLLDNLISAYFSSWSKADMQAYKSCFHPKASVYYLDSSGNPRHYLLEEFIAGQTKAHLAGSKPLTERPTKTTLAMQGRLAQAEVRWQLQQGSATATGTDYFIFAKTDTGWKILSLVYEQDKL